MGIKKTEKLLSKLTNSGLNIDTLVGRQLTVTYDLTGNKDINTILSEYSIGVNK